jgi:release factor glutamine methyltransferase
LEFSASQWLRGALLRVSEPVRFLRRAASRVRAANTTVSIHTRVSAARRRLRDAGIPPDEADLDARLLAEHLLGWDTARFFSAGGEPEPAGFAERYEALVVRRAAREPIAYITGRQEFWDLSFEVSPAVLIPRPESELIVEVALEILSRSARDGLRERIADACTGSGCLAVALARERPSAEIVATDLSQPALEIARRNARRHDVDRQIHLLAADILGGVEGPFDLIVSNPPYVPERERASLQPEVRDYEPPVALFAGADGLDVIRRLLDAATSRLERGGALVFELGFGQARAVEQLIAAVEGLVFVEVRPDLQGIPRTAVARRT